MDVDLAFSRRIVSPVVAVPAQRDAFVPCWQSRLATWRPSLMSLTWPGMLSRYLRALVVVCTLSFFRKRWRILDWMLTMLR